VRDDLAFYLAGAPAFALYFGAGLFMLVLFGLIYTALTPHKEWQLIRTNVPAAALAFGGSLLGFVLPLASAMRESVSLLDFLLWGLVALIAQLLTFALLRALIPGLGQRIGDNEMASGILVALSSVSVGVLNAAAMNG
jgi:putative membrane protein